MGCKYDNCKTNDPKAVAFCRECLIINFPRLNIDELYGLYVRIIDSIDFLVELGDFEAFQVYSPEELKDIAFEMYNELLLKKHEEENG